MKIGLVVPHMFMHRAMLPQVIFSPGQLALELAAGLQELGAEVTLFSPGPVDTPVRNITADLSLFDAEVAARGNDYIDLLKKHPMTFVSLARQVQAELVAAAFTMANRGELDIVHVYTNEEDIALPFAALCQKPVVFTHHDPFNFLVKYKNVFPKYKHLNWISLSLAQRKGMPSGTNWVGNIYHGVNPARFHEQKPSNEKYVAYLGRIIEPKGVHLAIGAVKQYNKTHIGKLKLKIAGKHYAGKKDIYWQQRIAPQIDGTTIQYVGFIGNDAGKQAFLGGAQALLVPSTFDEPFGMVTVEALACGTPVIGLASGAIPEVIEHGKTGFVVEKQSEQKTIHGLANAIEAVGHIRRSDCRKACETRFTTKRMCYQQYEVYNKLQQAYTSQSNGSLILSS